ncbi:TPA: adenylosuccinate synthase [Pseudomonas aeruginosa]|nr:adenylosuccinate synthase [Pseudomonas aeruginosa]
MSLIPMTHADLCSIAVKWLKRANSAGGPGCHVAVSECRSGWTGEVPDAIGFRAAGNLDDGSVVVECKTSRSDFLADRKKAHRVNGGCGNWRYFMAPEGIISPDELPERWGLLIVNSRGHVKAVAGLAVMYRESYAKDSDIAYWRHEANRDREQFILAKLLNRVGDVEEMNRKLRFAYSEQQRLAKRVNELNEQLRAKQLSGYLRRSA